MLAIEVKKYLTDILEAINAIYTIKTLLPDFNTFYSNRILRSAVERELQIIGEAINKIEKITPSIPITDIRKIKATRNIIVHDYEGINYQLLWTIIQSHIEILKKETKELLNS